MIKLILASLTLLCLNELAYCNIQLVIPNESHAISKSDKSSSHLANSISINNNLSIEDQSSHGVVEEFKNALENAAASAPVPASITRSKPSSSSSSISSPSITRTNPATSSSSISSSSGLSSRPSLVISSSAHATATGAAGSTSASISSQSSSPAASARSSTTIHHRILPAESIPLPITISTRPGLRTVIAPETITIQQPTITKIGEHIQNIPTAVSHQRSTVYHNHARVVTPIVGPGIRTVTSQVVRAYHTPLVYSPQISTIQVDDH